MMPAGSLKKLKLECLDARQMPNLSGGVDLRVIVLLLLCSLVPAAAADVPRRFVRIEAASAGLIVDKAARWGTSGQPFALSGRLVKVTCTLGRLRLGLAGYDGYGQFMGDWGEQMLVPFHVGVTLWSAPRPYWRLWGVVPDVYVEASASPWTDRYDPYFSGRKLGGRVSLCADIDRYGVGAQLECGWLFGRNTLYAGLRVRALAFGVGF